MSCLAAASHTNHFGHISKFFEINGQLLEIGWRSIDVSRVHKLVHRHFVRKMIVKSEKAIASA